MKRKAIQLAKQTIVVSLPTKWVKQQGIKKGDEIDVVEEENRLIIGSDKENEEIKKTINLDDYGVMRNRVVLANYLQGIDELELRFSKPEQIKEIKDKITSKLIGFEIIKQTQNSVILKEVAGFSRQDLDAIIRRIFLVIESMTNELLEALKKDQKDLNYIVMIDKEINKLIYYSIRVLNKRAYKEFKKISFLYSSLLCLENIGDLYRDIAKDIMKYKIKLSKIDLENLKLINELFILFEKTFFNFKNENLIELSELYEKIKEKITKYSHKSNQNIILHNYFSQILGSIIMLTNNLLMMI